MHISLVLLRNDPAFIDDFNVVAYFKYFYGILTLAANTLLACLNKIYIIYIYKYINYFSFHSGLKLADSS